MTDNFELIISITLIISFFLITCIIFLFKNSTPNSERLNILLERQDNLQKNIIEIIENNIEKIDLKVEKSNFNHSNNLNFIREKISVIDRAHENITNLTDNVLSLKNILSNTTKRGRFGEMMLENIIKDQLPSSNYEFQKTLSNQNRVDCVIKSPGPLGQLCIDAKFPRENYEKITNAKTKIEKDNALKLFKNDILKHINDVSSKYIIPGETSDIALIFIPSESIYLEIFKYYPNISKTFFLKKSFLISPTTLWVILTSIESMLRDKKIQENSSIIQNELHNLNKELIRLESRVKKLDSHFSNAQTDLNEILITTKKITNKNQNILRLNLEKKD